MSAMSKSMKTIKHSDYLDVLHREVGQLRAQNAALLEALTEISMNDLPFPGTAYTKGRLANQLNRMGAIARAAIAEAEKGETA